MADVTLPPVISDRMVLQAGMPVPIFGNATSGELVNVEFDGQKKSTTTDQEGKWLVRLDSMSSKGPLDLKVQAKNTIIVKDVMVGEVWFASGQSNMKYPLRATIDGSTAVAQATHPRIRYFAGASWVESKPDSAGEFSAVAYHFGRNLEHHLKVPVGLIEVARNGEVGQSFISKSAFEADAELANLVKQQGKPTSEIFESSIRLIIPYGIRGALWYQGEGNRDFPVTYSKLLPALISDWRKQWGQGDFPFLIVQLANWQERKSEPWEGKDCALREVQLKTAQLVNNAGLVVTIDLGISDDVHYPNKKPVGDRLAIAARGIAYHEDIEYSGPLVDSIRFDGSQAIISFTHTGTGLVAQGGKLKGFLVCGADKRFIRADAQIVGEKVVVQSDILSDLVAVRYAWERNPDCNLYNKEGLPASPFRSDDFANEFTTDGTFAKSLIRLIYTAGPWLLCVPVPLIWILWRWRRKCN